MDPDTETWKDAIEALDPERRARDVVDVYRRDIYRNERHAWHWDQPTALALTRLEEREIRPDASARSRSRIPASPSGTKA